MSVPPRSPARGLSVLIVGAGVGGLVAALECWRHGFDVRILERTKASSTLGDSFQIGYTAMHVFRKHWLELAKRSDEEQYEVMVSLHKNTGERFAGPFPIVKAMLKGVADELGITAKDMPRHLRPVFHRLLLEQVDKLGLAVEYDHEVVDYFEDAATKRAGAVTVHGERIEADIVVAADGVRTPSWQLINGKPTPAKSSGDALLRVIYPRALIEDDKEVMERFGQLVDGKTIAEMWHGPGSWAGFWLYDTHMMWLLAHPDDGTALESWSHHVSTETALSYAAAVPGWPEYAKRVIAATPENTIVDWKLMWRDPQPRWTSPAGLVVALGDAAHTFLPTSGSGATQAIEDATSLATCLALGLDRGASIPDALRAHNLLRFQRVSFLQVVGIANRNARVDQKNRDSMAFGRWIVAHDAEDYAAARLDEALHCVRTGTEADFKHTSGVPKRPYMPWTIESVEQAQATGAESIIDGDWS